MAERIPPLRAEPFTPDTFDGERAEWAKGMWHGQDAALQARDRSVEENIRMLAGQQWIFWSDLLGKFVDITKLLSDDERRWRQRPVVNRLMYWYMLMHARMTENPPVVAFQPASADRSDALLAETMDVVCKTLWNEVGMLEITDRLMSWLIPSGRAYLKSRIDPLRGEVREWMGPAVLEVVDPETGEPTGEERYVDNVPYRPGEDGGDAVPDATAYADGSLDMGEPHREYEGGIRVDVLSCLEVRGAWGPDPWHEKSWHIHRVYLPVEEVEATFGVKVEADSWGYETDGAGELERMLFGTGFFGAVENKPTANAPHRDKKGGGRVCVYEVWCRPSTATQGMMETSESAGGRLLIVTKSGKVLRDGPRPARFRYTSPIQAFGFVNLPGRPHETSPQEMLNPIQRTMNRGWAQILEHRNLSTNPIGVVDSASGINEGQVVNRAGVMLHANKRQGVAPLEYVAPPPLSADVWRTQDQLAHEFETLGNVTGAEGASPTQDASGELVKELRFNSDRFIGPAVRRATFAFARVVEDWIALLPTIWDQKKILTYAGEDQVLRTITVLPDMWKGKVHVVPEIESMLPEGRGERQARVRQMYAEGIFGPPGTPEAIKVYLDLIRFPHLGRAVAPGGVHRVTATQENGRLVQGEPAQGIPVLEWYAHDVHLLVHFEFMASPEYLRLPVQVQREFYLHTEAHKVAIQQMMMEQAAQQMGAQAGMLGMQAAAGQAMAPAQQMISQQQVDAQMPQMRAQAAMDSAAGRGGAQGIASRAAPTAADSREFAGSRRITPQPATAPGHQPTN